MAVPEQVRQRAEAVNKMYEQQAQPQGQPEPTDEPAAQPEAEAPAEEQPDAGQAGAGEEAAVPQEQVQEHEDDGQGGEEPSSDINQRLSEMEQQIKTSDQRQRTLEGMMDAKEAENRQLRDMLSKMHEQPAQPQQEAPQSNPDDAKDKELFGEDFVDMIERRISARVNQLEQRLGEAESAAQRSSQVSDDVQQERFQTKLTQRVSNWQEIDNDPDFRDWVSNSRTRVAIIKEAMANYDADAVADVFDQYIALKGKGQEKKPEPAKKPLESKVAPSKGRASSPSSESPEKKQWTRSEIAQVFANRRNYSSEKFSELQKDIFAAQKEDRVDYSR